MIELPYILFGSWVIATLLLFLAAVGTQWELFAEREKRIEFQQRWYEQQDQNRLLEGQIRELVTLHATPTEEFEQQMTALTDATTATVQQIVELAKTWRPKPAPPEIQLIREDQSEPRGVS